MNPLVCFVCLLLIHFPCIIFAQPNTVLFRETFETPGPNNRYGFGYMWPQSATTWQTQHLPNGSWNGTGAARVTVAGCTTDCNAVTNQWDFGWATPALNRNFALGDHVYIRFRIRFNNANRWCDNCNTRNKFILMGRSRTEPFNSRILMWMHGPNEGNICSLGATDWDGTGQVYPWARPSYFGLPYSNWQQTNGTFGSIEPYVNIGGYGSCSPATLTTYGNHPNPPAPGPNSAAPINGWYHYQVYAKSGNSTTSAFSVWVNNNNFSAPTSSEVGLNDGLGVIGWTDGAHLGGYQGVSERNLNIGWDIDDFEIGLSFDPLWYPH